MAVATVGSVVRAICGERQSAFGSGKNKTAAPGHRSGSLSRYYSTKENVRFVTNGSKMIEHPIDHDIYEKISLCQFQSGTDVNRQILGRSSFLSVHIYPVRYLVEVVT